MKRRNADCGKLRRPIKRNKIAEGMYGSTTVLYMKFLVLWAIVITADFMFMFRFEFLWPFWLLLRSVHDSFKYKGLAFSIVFVCIAVTSDVICLFFIPVSWLFFIASTYVWVQYVWHTDKGICLPTVILWMLFVYLEAGIRWKDSRHAPHLDLCRPFAAHCIGYPVVTLGFGFKSYVSYRMRQRKQREVSKENEFYMQLLQQALPQEEPTATVAATTLNDGTSPASVNQQIAGVQATGSTQAVLSNNSTQNAQNNPNIHNHHQQHNHHSHSNHTSSLNTSVNASASVSTSTLSTSASSSLSSSLSSSSLSVVAAGATTQSSSSSNTQNAGVAMNGSISSGFVSAQNQHNHNHNHNHNNHQQQQQQQQPHANENQNHSNGSNHSHASNLSSNHSNSHHNHSSSSSSSSSNNGSSIPTATSVTGTATTLSTNVTTSSSQVLAVSSNSDDKHYVQIGNGGSLCASSSTPTSASTSSTVNSGGATLNGHIGGGGAKSHRRSVDKENKNRASVENADSTSKHNKNNNSNHVDHHNSGHPNSNNNKEKTEWDNSNHQLPSTNPTTAQNAKERHNNNNQSNHADSTHSASAKKASTTLNGNVLQYDAEEVVAVEPVERTKGRRNRAKKENNHASKDNHHNNNNNNSSAHNNNQNLNHNHNSDASSVSSSTSTVSSSTTNNSSNNPSTTSNVVNTASAAISNMAVKVVSKICESCLKLEADIKKYRYELSHMKNIEKELRQKLDANQELKNCLQAKQKECDELEKRVNELTNLRHSDHKASERRLQEERRQRQSLDAQLNNEKKARKLAEEKAARPECSAQCKQRKQQMDEEIKQLRRDLKQVEDAKQLAEQHGLKWEQEVRMFEAEIRNRDSNQHGTEMLMNALATMQDRNSTLEKNLSAETRVKLDLFSALGDAKRQLEISESRRRSKEDEVLDLKAKIAQLLAIMPTDALCLPSCSSTGASSMLRMNDTPPLQTCPGPASPMLNSLNAAQASNNANSHQMTSRVVVAPPTSAAEYVHQQSPTDYQQHQHTSHHNQHQHHQHQQHQQHQQQQLVPVSVATSVLVSGTVNNVNGNVSTGSSGLDPNATVYTPKAPNDA